WATDVKHTVDDSRSGDRDAADFRRRDGDRDRTNFDGGTVRHRDEDRDSRDPIGADRGANGDRRRCDKRRDTDRDAADFRRLDGSGDRTSFDGGQCATVTKTVTVGTRSERIVGRAVTDVVATRDVTPIEMRSIFVVVTMTVTGRTL